MSPIAVSPVSSYETIQWHVTARSWDILKGQVPSNIDVGSIVDKSKAWFVALVHHALEHISKVKTWIVSMIPSTPEHMNNIKTWIVSAIHNAPEHIDKIKTWIGLMAHRALEHIDIVIQGIIAILHQHPYTALVISTLISFPMAVFIPPILFSAVCIPVLGILGFCVGGIATGSPAAAFQSAYYGASVPAGGLFATLQSLGATMSVSIPIVITTWVFLIVPWLISCAIWIYVVFGILLH